MKYRYFVSFQFVMKDCTPGFGNFCIDLDNKPTCWQDIDFITRKICDRLEIEDKIPVAQLVILNLVLLEAI